VEIDMSNKIFTDKEIERLSNNKYVKAVSKKGITYTDEFKRIFIAEYENGKSATIIFEKYGFDIEILGLDRIYSSGKRWRKAYKNDGVCGLQDTRKENSGRPSEKELSIEEKYERLRAQNNLLKAENELLKKIKMLERGLIKKK
jgi:transposase